MSPTVKGSPMLPNFFGGLGYLSIILQWLWSASLLLPALLENNTVKDFLLPQPTTDTHSALVQFDENSLFVIILSVIVTVVVLIITMAVLIRLPIALIKTSKKSVNTTVQTLIPIASHHRKITKKERIILSAKIRFFIKLVLIITPLISLCLLFFTNTELPSDVIVFVACMLAVGSVVWFGLQEASARILRINLAKLI